MPIPQKRIPIDLNPAEITTLTPENLQEQLHGIGLDCEHTNPKVLERYIRDVKSGLPNGDLQVYHILMPARKGKDWPEVLPGLFSAALGQWIPKRFGYEAELHYLQFKEHFSWLLKNRKSFPGIEKNPPPYTGKYDSVAAVKEMFKQTGTDASAGVVKGIDRDAIEAILANAISPVTAEQAKDYDESDSAVIYLVDNYDPVSKEADAVGVLTLEWRLQIKNYKEKKKDPQHATTLTVSTRSVLYSNLDQLYADLDAAKAHFGDSLTEVLS